jgi:acyl-CoA reductase-like NAD-dependent aldehyde dehydrogenase
VNQQLKLQNFIGNEFVDPNSKKWFAHLSPWSGAPSCDVPDSDLMDVVRAIQSANKAWTNWQKTEPRDRAPYLESIARQLELRIVELAKVQSEDEGASEDFALSHSLPRAIEIFRSYARRLQDETTQSAATPRAVFQSHRQPYGVVSVITPYADPFVTLAARVAPALAAGNAMIVKPSEFAPRSAHEFAVCMAASGLPTGVFNLVQGRGEAVGQSLATHPGLSMISFTGSTAVGRQIFVQSAEFLKRTHLAMGARNPVIIFGSVDLAKMMPAIVQATIPFQGATCLRGSRIFVQEAIYKEFLEAYKIAVEKIAPKIGPLNRAAHRDQFHAAVAQATSENGKLLFGGSNDERPGFFVAPTAVFDLTNCSTLQQEEVIGPFVTISSFKYQHDAIKQANTSPYGQAAYLFEPNGAKALRVAQKLEAGRIFINSPGPIFNGSIASGGLKTSGLGREGANELLEFFSKSSLIIQSTATDA